VTELVERIFKLRPECERLHQGVLSALLAEPALIERLAGIAVTRPEVKWEPDSGAFDLAVESASHPRVLVELKLDDVLTRKRIVRQLEQARKIEGQRAVYLLLGASGISRGAHWPDWSEVYGIEEYRVHSSHDLGAALESCCSKVDDTVWIELARGYVEVLRGLQKKYQEFVGKGVEAFEVRDYLGYFDVLRKTAGIAKARVQKVSARKREGFVCLAWGGTPACRAKIYLQFEGKDLRLKLAAHEYGREQRKSLRRQVQAAAEKLVVDPGLGFVVHGKGSGKTMTLGRFDGVKLAGDPSDSGSELVALVKKAEVFVALLGGEKFTDVG
jgi:hypothetical protein